jgi:hypothetical protein
VQGSIYAADKLLTTEGDLAFSQSSAGDEQKLIDLCQTAKNASAVVMYDLVLNHLGANSTQLAELQQKFQDEGNYGELATIHKPFWDAKAFNYDDPKVREFVFNNLHKPVLDKLISYGIEGFRVDAAGHVNLEYQNMVANYLNEEGAKEGKKFEIILEHMHSEGGITKEDCMDVWQKDNLNPNLTTSSFLGTKLSEQERETLNGAPKWTQEELYNAKHFTSGMISNHDEHNIYSKVASLIATQSLLNSGYKSENRLYYGDDTSVTQRQLYNGNISEPEREKYGYTILSDTSGILTIENQIKILNGELKEEHEFAGFGKIDREKLIENYKAKAIEIAHVQIEQNRQVMVNVGPTGDFGGALGSHLVFSKPEDFAKNKRVLDVKTTCADIDTTPEVTSMLKSKKEHTTLREGQWLERVVIVVDPKNPHSDFVSVILKHQDGNYYNDKDKIEISYACTKTKLSPDEVKSHIIKKFQEENRHPGKDIANTIQHATVYDSLGHSKEVAERTKQAGLNPVTDPNSQKQTNKVVGKISPTSNSIKELMDFATVSNLLNHMLTNK